MQQYYYSASETVWSPWTDSQLKSWLVERGIIKSDAQVSRDKMRQMIKCGKALHFVIDSFF